ncbi:fatty acid hydroxylase superfamily protein [Tilletiaria anomala UBC 951]|uniref:Fatty acid hydroxylase superfamily protein n=1 Tax=Tilletiaria anomala (strain ATCC 24038 / CBS 436.72 / UBC 951) TaxID=1037660 RepID=A0A066WJR0_TILAU|nr:fatty acid hydroxylase superfamily protein [Tilletiaria anomala UBC 951]KDN52793.1 fatty acid hydroxylase superfamily protein [Tilletiaria anomala UBC 951]
MPDGITSSLASAPEQHSTGEIGNKDDAENGSNDASVRNAQKAFMYTSWPSKPRSEWTRAQRFIAFLDVLPNFPGKKAAPIKKKDDPVPVWTFWQQHAHTLPWAVAPVLMHWSYMKFTGATLHPIAAYVLYTAAYNGLSVWSTQKVNKFAMKYGFLDGNAPRDGVPDDKDWHILSEVLKVVLLRPLIGLFLIYDRNELPSVTWLVPVKLFLWSITLDFWFYWYHRAMHEVPALWKYHKTHHMTKHPSSLLSAFADTEQEIFDAYIVPFLTYLVMLNLGPLSVTYAEAFICIQYVITAESGGHSGARIYASSPCNSIILRPLGMELDLEDHDLHHRHGWKHYGGNYGKQTRLWDVIFGTSKPRIETVDKNIDWSWKVSLP